VQRVHLDVDVLPSFMADGACRCRQHPCTMKSQLQHSQPCRHGRNLHQPQVLLVQSFHNYFAAARLSCSDILLLRWCTCAAGLHCVCLLLCLCLATTAAGAVAAEAALLSHY
jgi:hypothetical protein